MLFKGIFRNKMTNKLPPDVSLIINRADNIGLSCHANRQESVFSQFPYPIPCYPGNRGPHFRLTRVFSYLCRPRPISWGGGCMSISTEKDIPHVFEGSGLRTLKPEKIAVKFLSWCFFCFSVFIPRLPGYLVLIDVEMFRLAEIGCRRVMFLRLGYPSGLWL